MSKEFEEWWDEQRSKRAKQDAYAIAKCTWAAAESRGIAKGRIEGMREAAGIVQAEYERVMGQQSGVQDEFNRKVDLQIRFHAMLLPDIAAAILSTSQPQEIAGEGCEWVMEVSTCSGKPVHFYETGCDVQINAAYIHTRGFKFCPYCGKPIVIGGER